MTVSAGPVGLISNPNSGHNRDQFPAIEARIRRCPTILHHTTQRFEDLDPALAQLAEAGVQVLAINGGDGTVSAVLGRLLESRRFVTPPRIILLPGGTANMTAGDVGLQGSLQRAVERFCRWCGSDRKTSEPPRKRALLRVCEGQREPRYGMFLGAGAVIHGTEYAHREIHSRGLRDDFSLALGTLRTVWGIVRDDPRFNRHVTIGLGIDGQSARQFDTVILVVSTLERLSFGMRPFYGSGPGDIRLTVFEQGCRHFARTFVSIVRGRPNRHAVPAAGYHSFNTARLRLQMHGEFNLDGEIHCAREPLEVTVSERLEFLRL